MLIILYLCSVHICKSVVILTYVSINRRAQYQNFLHTIYCYLKHHNTTNYHDVYTLCSAELNMQLHAVKQLAYT